MPLKLALYGLAGLALVGVALYLRHAGYVAGEAAEHVLWVKDVERRDTATRQAIDAERARSDAARKANEVIESDYQQKLSAIGSDRDSLYKLLQRSRDQVRGLASSQATGQLGLDALTGIATRASEAEEAVRDQWDRYDAACQRDAVRFSALQDQLRPQL